MVEADVSILILATFCQGSVSIAFPWSLLNGDGDSDWSCFKSLVEFVLVLSDVSVRFDLSEFLRIDSSASSCLLGCVRVLFDSVETTLGLRVFESVLMPSSFASKVAIFQTSAVNKLLIRELKSTIRIFGQNS